MHKRQFSFNFFIFLSLLMNHHYYPIQALPQNTIIYLPQINFPQSPIKVSDPIPFVENQSLRTVEAYGTITNTSTIPIKDLRITFYYRFQRWEGLGERTWYEIKPMEQVVIYFDETLPGESNAFSFRIYPSQHPSTGVMYYPEFIKSEISSWSFSQEQQNVRLMATPPKVFASIERTPMTITNQTNFTISDIKVIHIGNIDNYSTGIFATSYPTITLSPKQSFYPHACYYSQYFWCPFQVIAIGKITR